MCWWRSGENNLEPTDVSFGKWERCRLQQHSHCHFFRHLLSLSHFDSQSASQFFWIALFSNLFLILQLVRDFFSQISSLLSLAKVQLEFPSACLIKTSSCNTFEDLALATIIFILGPVATWSLLFLCLPLVHTYLDTFVHATPAFYTLPSWDALVWHCF